MKLVCEESIDILRHDLFVILTLARRFAVQKSPDRYSVHNVKAIRRTCLLRVGCRLSTKTVKRTWIWFPLIQRTPLIYFSLFPPWFRLVSLYVKREEHGYLLSFIFVNCFLIFAQTLFFIKFTSFHLFHFFRPTAGQLVCSINFRSLHSDAST